MALQAGLGLRDCSLYPCVSPSVLLLQDITFEWSEGIHLCCVPTSATGNQDWAPRHFFSGMQGAEVLPRGRPQLHGGRGAQRDVVSVPQTKKQASLAPAASVFRPPCAEKLCSRKQETQTFGLLGARRESFDLSCKGLSNKPSGQHRRWHGIP